MDFSKKRTYSFNKIIINQQSISEELFEARSVIFNNGFYKKVLKVLESLIEKYAQNRVLDIGCGGRLLY